MRIMNNIINFLQLVMLLTLYKKQWNKKISVTIDIHINYSTEKKTFYLLKHRTFNYEEKKLDLKIVTTDVNEFKTWS